MSSAYSLTSQEWFELFKLNGEGKAAASFFMDGLYRNPDVWKKHLSQRTLGWINQQFSADLPIISLEQKSQDGTVKFQLKFADSMEVETVLIPFRKKYTVCLSTQVGCGMNCSFCYTGTQGLKRNLTAGEIVAQYLVAKKYLGPLAPLPAIVFMGQGEPLHNSAAVRKALDVLLDANLIGVGHRNMTLSTVGYLPALADLISFPRINIALSLHSPFEEQRSELIPINQRYPLKDVLPALDAIPLLKRQFITFEYLLIKDFNMSISHAEELQKLLGHRKALVNLIPFNPFPGSKWQRPTPEEVETFRQELVKRKLRVMVRTTKGDEILAACGQLKIKELARNYAG